MYNTFFFTLYIYEEITFCLLNSAEAFRTYRKMAKNVAISIFSVNSLYFETFLDLAKFVEDYIPDHP